MRRVHLSINTSYILSKESMELSREYTAFDWTNILLGPINTVYRALFVNTKCSIQNPGLLVAILLSNWSDLDMLLKSVNNIDILKIFYDAIKGKGPSASPIGINLTVLRKCHIYKQLILNYRKVDLNDYQKYNDMFNAFKIAIDGIKKVYCKKCSEYTLSTSQISDLKKFKPDKAKDDMVEAINYFKRNGNEEFVRLTEDVSEFVTNEVIKYITDNIEK